MRAKNFLHGSERATLGAIKEAIARQGISADVVEPEGAPGYVEITLHAETISPEQEQRLLTAIEESRPAGVKVMPPRVQPPRKVNLELRLTTVSGLLEQDLRAAQRSVRENIEDYFARLPVREAGSINRIVGLVLGVPGVEDVRLLSATWLADGVVEDVLDTSTGQLEIGGYPTVLGDLQIADPNLPTLLSVTVSHPEDEDPPDVPEIQSALSDALAYLNARTPRNSLPTPRWRSSHGGFSRTASSCTSFRFPASRANPWRTLTTRWRLARPRPCRTRRRSPRTWCSSSLRWRAA